MRAAPLALLTLLVAAPASADWTVRERASLPRFGAVDLAEIADPGEDPVRVALTGSLSFTRAGSEIDALSETANGVRDEASGPFVTLPPGSRVVDADPAAHRYVVEVPRAASMPVALNLYGLSTRYLLTVSEVDADLIGAIELEHLVPPPPPPSPSERAVGAATQTASEIGVAPIAGAGLGAFALGVLGFLGLRRRRERVATLLRRAERARGAIAREAVAIGPAFDPVAATADRLLEATAQQAAHVRSMSRALDRTAWTGSAEARARRRELERRRDDGVARLETLVARLEATATELAGRAADTARASGVDRLVAELGMDLDAASEAEDELARI